MHLLAIVSPLELVDKVASGNRMVGRPALVAVGPATAVQCQGVVVLVPSAVPYTVADVDRTAVVVDAVAGGASKKPILMWVLKVPVFGIAVMRAFVGRQTRRSIG